MRAPQLRICLTVGCLSAFLLAPASLPAEEPADNRLTDAEKKDGWLLLFDGKTLTGWQTSSGQPSQRPVENGSINPHKCGGYMMIYEKPWDDFTLSLDFKISPKCN